MTIARMRQIPGLWALTMLVLPGGAAAQEDVMSLKELAQSGGLRRGDAVDVFAASGRVLRGDVGDVSSTVLTIITDSDTRRTTDVPAGDLREILFRDSLTNGMLWGFAVGFASVPIYCQAEGLIDSEQCGYVFFYYGLPGIAVTTLIGAIIDSKMRRTIRIGPPQSGSAAVSVSPMFSGDRFGARMSVSW